MTARTKQYVINITAVFGAVCGAIAYVAPRGAAMVDSRYVHAGTFALLRQRDSLNYRADIKDIHRILARIDSTLIEARRGRR